MYFSIQRSLIICKKVGQHLLKRNRSPATTVIHLQTARQIHIRPNNPLQLDATKMSSKSAMVPEAVTAGGGDCGVVRVNNIVKSVQDSREYRGLQLVNGMKVLLVSDPTTDKSAAAITVDVGHMNDPDELPGLAHFLEHMLFLGTEKYPNENEYSSYVSQNGGSSNAATYADNTKYFFDVVPSKFDGALDRFAQFFITPLFTESATQREINAVHSEHEKNLAADVWRIRQVNKSLASDTHPYRKFGSGNKETLSEIPKEKGIDVRTELIKFHNEWYSANIMCLSVFGKESLDELEEMVVSKFSLVGNKNIKATIWDEQPYLPEHFAQKVHIVPIKDVRNLTLSFPTGDLDQYYKSGPEHYIIHILGHEGKGSVLSYFKEKGWCNDLMAGHSTFARGFGFFDIMVNLTEEGCEHVDDIIAIIFQAIEMLKTQGPEKRIFDEYRNISEMQFRFKDKENAISFVTSVVHSMQIYPLDEVLTAPYLVSDWNPELVNQLLLDMTPEKCRITLVGQKLEPMCTETETWYGTKYVSLPIPKETVEKWSQCGLNDKLALPPPNPFIATDFSIFPLNPEEQTKFPTIIHDTPCIRMWFKQDDEFFKPKLAMNFDFNSPLAYADPLACNLIHMFAQLYRDQLNEYLYAAELAGLRLNVANTAHGISLSISGYNEKQLLLLDKVLENLFLFEFDTKRFEIYKEQLLRGLKNFSAEQPYQHSVYYLALLLSEQGWSKQELIGALDLVTPDRLRAYVKEFLSRIHVECLIYGNIDKKKCMETVEVVEKRMNATNSSTLPLLARQLMLKREYKLQPGENFVFVTNNEFHKSSCSQLYLQCGIQSDRANVFIDLLAQVINEPCYNTLRTQEQLGYIVFSGSRKANSVQGIRFIVQSNQTPAFVEERIESFLADMVTKLQDMTDDEFNLHKDSLAAQKLEKPKRIGVMFNRYLNEIALQQYHFDRAEVEVAILKTITKQEMIDHYMKYVVKDSPHRQTLSIHIVSTAEGGAGHTDAAAETGEPKEKKPNTGGSLITDLTTFKAGREMYPVLLPYINVPLKGGKSKL